MRLGHLRTTGASTGQAMLPPAASSQLTGEFFPSVQHRAEARCRSCPPAGLPGRYRSLSAIRLRAAGSPLLRAGRADRKQPYVAAGWRR